MAHWRAGKFESALRVRLQDSSTTRTRLPATSRGTISRPARSAGLDVEYLMLRGFFMAPGVTKDATAYYVDMFKKVRETPEWAKLMSDGAFNTTFMAGDEYVKWVANAEKLHEGLMKEAGFLAAKSQLKSPAKQATARTQSHMGECMSETANESGGAGTVPPERREPVLPSPSASSVSSASSAVLRSVSVGATRGRRPASSRSTSGSSSSSRPSSTW